MKNFESKNIINWGELSRILAGHRSSITKNRISKKHKEQIDKLLNVVNEWYDYISSDSEKPEN